MARRQSNRRCVCPWDQSLHVARHAVVARIAHDLVLDFFPALKAFLDQHLGNASERKRATTLARSPRRDGQCRFLSAQVKARTSPGSPIIRIAVRASSTERHAWLRAVLTPISSQALDEQMPIFRISDCLDQRAQHPECHVSQERLYHAMQVRSSRQSGRRTTGAMASTPSLMMIFSTNSGSQR